VFLKESKRRTRCNPIEGVNITQRHQTLLQRLADGTFSIEAKLLPFTLIVQYAYNTKEIKITELPTNETAERLFHTEKKKYSSEVVVTSRRRRIEKHKTSHCCICGNWKTSRTSRRFQRESSERIDSSVQLYSSNPKYGYQH
jgi:iron complex outermembrane receptor protein